MAVVSHPPILCNTGGGMPPGSPPGKCSIKPVRVQFLEY